MNHDLHDSIREQASASRQRLEDARVLLRASRWRGSMYIAGYAVECLLKTKLMPIYDCKNLRELDDVLQKRFVLPVGSTTFTHQVIIVYSKIRIYCLCSTWLTVGHQNGVTSRSEQLVMKPLFS